MIKLHMCDWAVRKWEVCRSNADDSLPFCVSSPFGVQVLNSLIRLNNIPFM
jgi:hypothetical protein